MGSHACLIYRRAGACPPRAFDLRENRAPPQAVFRADRGMARDRPSPYGKRHAFFNRSAGACPPRSFDPRENRTPANAVFPTEARRGTGPRPTVKGGGLATIARFGSGRSRTTVTGVRGRSRGTGPRATGQDEKKRGGQAPTLQRRTARHYSRCFTSPNVVNARFAGETGPGKRRVRNVSGRPPNETSSIW